MLYFIEMISGKDFDHQVRVIKIGFTRNLKKRLSTYYTHNGLYEVVRVLKGKEFDWECEQILHSHFANKRYDRREFFIKDEELMKTILGIKTRDDIIRLRKNHCSKWERLKFQKIFKGILAMNWNIIKTVCDEDIDFVIDYILTKESYNKVEDINIFESVKNLFGVDILDYPEEIKECAYDFFREYNKIGTRQKKLKFLCEKLPTLSELERTCILGSITEVHFLEYIEILGLDECKAQAYNTSLLNKKMNIVGFDKNLLKEDIYSEFKVGQTYPNAYSKQKLGEIYNKNNFRATPKSCDLDEYFNTRSKKAKDETGKWVNGFYIISKKIDSVEFDKNLLKEDIYNEFKVGHSYSNPYIKQKLGDIYDQKEYKATAKAVDLDEYFETKYGKVKDETGKWVNGFNIISKK